MLADPSERSKCRGWETRPPRMLSRQALAGVIEPRVEEIYSWCPSDSESGYEELLSSGIVISGGAAVMRGMVELGEDIFLKPVARHFRPTAGPLYDMVANPRSATVMGLLEEARIARSRGMRAAQQAGSVKNLVGRMKDWFLGNFLNEVHHMQNIIHTERRPAAPPVRAEVIEPAAQTGMGLRYLRANGNGRAPTFRTHGPPRRRNTNKPAT